MGLSEVDLQLHPELASPQKHVLDAPESFNAG